MLLIIHLVSRQIKMKKLPLYNLIFPVIFLFIATSCQSIPKNALQLSSESLKLRQTQSRRFDTNDEAKILCSCAALIQDLGFNLDESETELGVIVGSKARSAVSAAQVAGSIILAVLTGAVAPVDKNQRMRVSVITRPIGENNTKTIVRVTFQRIVWNTQGIITKREGLTDPKIYQEFFEKLSKAVFLEAHKI